MKTWQIVLITVIVVLLIGSIGMNIYQHVKNNADSQPPEVPKTSTTTSPTTEISKTNTTVDPTESELTERAAYILDYYDARIDSLNKNLSFKPIYFTPIDIDSLSADSIDDRYLLWLIEKYGYLPENKYGAEKGKAVGSSITAWVSDFGRQIETFRTYTSDYASISKEEARKFFVDMEVWCGSFQEAADSITSTLDSYNAVLDKSWHSRIDTILEELMKVQEEMLTISEEIYKAKQ